MMAACDRIFVVEILIGFGVQIIGFADGLNTGMREKEGIRDGS